MGRVCTPPPIPQRASLRAASEGACWIQEGQRPSRPLDLNAARVLSSFALGGIMRRRKLQHHVEVARKIARLSRCGFARPPTGERSAEALAGFYKAQHYR